LTNRYQLCKGTDRQTHRVPLFCVLPMKDKSKFVFGPSCWKGVWFHILPLHCHGRRVCGKSKAKVGNGECVWTLWVSEWVSEWVPSTKELSPKTHHTRTLSHTHTLWCSHAISTIKEMSTSFWLAKLTNFVQGR